MSTSRFTGSRKKSSTQQVRDRFKKRHAHWVEISPSETSPGAFDAVEVWYSRDTGESATAIELGISKDAAYAAAERLSLPVFDADEG